MALNPDQAVTLDDRPIWAKLRRVDVQDMLSANEIAFDPLTGKDALLKIAEGHGIDVASQEQLQKTEDYRAKKAQIRGERYLNTISQQGAPKQKARMDERLVLASQMDWNQLRTYVKEFGITWKAGDTRTVLEKQLKEKIDGENAAAGT